MIFSHKFLFIFRILHGRRGFTGRRRLQGTYINRDEYLSKLRILHMKYGKWKTFLNQSLTPWLNNSIFVVIKSVSPYFSWKVNNVFKFKHPRRGWKLQATYINRDEYLSKLRILHMKYGKTLTTIIRSLWQVNFWQIIYFWVITSVCVEKLYW